MNQSTEKIERIKAIIEEELEEDFNMNRLRPYSRLKHLKEHIFFKIDNLSQESKNTEKPKDTHKEIKENYNQCVKMLQELKNT